MDFPIFMMMFGFRVGKKILYGIMAFIGNKLKHNLMV